MRLDLKDNYRMIIVVCVELFSAAAEVLSVGFAVASIYKQSAGAAAAELNSLCDWSMMFILFPDWSLVNDAYSGNLIDQ